MRALDVGIVGCGFAGAASAALLGRAGHRVTVYEEFAEPSAVGAGIVLQPTGMSVLAELGVLGRVLERGARLESLHCVTPSNRDVFRLDYAQLHPGLFGLGMHRGALFQILHELADRAGSTLRRATSVGGVSERPGKAQVLDRAGKPIAEHDLLVIANGARSDLRRASGLLRRERPYPWGALWFVARDPEHVYRNRLRQITNGTRHMLGLLPTGLGPREGGTDEHRVSLFWSIRMDRVDHFRRAGFAAWKEQILRYEPEAAFVLDQIESVEQVLTAGYHDVVMSPWHTQRQVFIGDAAHAMSPQLGQGTNLALMDASALCAALTEDVPLAIALERYSRTRRAQIDFYQFASRWLTPLFQSDLQALGPLRNAVMSLACQLPIMREEMLRTMAGVKRGIARPSLSLSPILAQLPQPR
ncbi:MAG TPA: NAD(P)/FAD-dependent oxidoreductase [Polyangiaceae bacterium]|jgi:2-polyprenyl-6-methoxyphenol hydroxylase-like FAD-dependent oxidoreductase